MSLPSTVTSGCGFAEQPSRADEPHASSTELATWPSGPSGWPRDGTVILERAETGFGALVLGPMTVIASCPQCGLKLGTASVVLGPVRAAHVELDRRAIAVFDVMADDVVGPGPQRGDWLRPRGEYVGPIPSISAAPAGQEDVSVIASSPLEIPAGGYARVVVGDGAAPATLRLAGGRYVLQTLEITARSRLECLADCRILVHKRWTVGDEGRVGGTGADPQAAADVEIVVLGSGEALHLHDSSQVSARVYVPNGRAVLASGAQLRGTLVARSLRMETGSVLRPARCLLADGRCSERNGLDFALPLPNRDDSEFHESGIATQHVLVAWKPGTSWPSMRTVLRRVRGTITGALPAHGVTSVDFERPFAFEPSRAQRIAFQTVLGPAAGPVEDLRREPSVAAAEYVLDARPGHLPQHSPFDPPRYDDGTPELMAVRPAVAFAGESVGVAILEPPDDDCAFVPHLLPEPPGAGTARFAITLERRRQQQCTLDPDLFERPASAGVQAAASRETQPRRVLVPLGNLPEGGYDVFAGPHHLSFRVLPDSGFGPELDPEVRVKLEVARAYWPQTCAGTTRMQSRPSSSARALVRLLRQKFPDLEQDKAETLGLRAASVRVRREGNSFSFSLREPACGADMEFEGRVTKETGTALERLHVGPLALRPQR